MGTIERDIIVQRDGEVIIDNIPCQKGDHVRARIEISGGNNGNHRAEARRKLIDLARSSNFTSQAPYPSRDQLHERH